MDIVNFSKLVVPKTIYLLMLGYVTYDQEQHERSLRGAAIAKLRHSETSASALNGELRGKAEDLVRCCSH
jgi:hypothetical protein